MEQINHFTHEHPLSLVYLRMESHLEEDSDDENSDDDDDEKDGDDSVVELEHHGNKCNMCEEDIYSFHVCYYDCKECDYSLHKFCAELPLTLQNNHLHPSHNLKLMDKPLYSWPYYDTGNWTCDVCNLTYTQDKRFFRYHCSICKFDMDIICATMSEQKMVHPSHPHRLERILMRPMTSKCQACGDEHTGTFYHCTTCIWFWIHLDCALLPAKLLIQQATKDSFTHSHPLTLAYSFPYVDYETKYRHTCRVCNSIFRYSLWLYKCDKCWYYAHVDCATSKKQPKKGLGRTFKNFKDHLHPNLLECPFPDESYNLLRHTFSNQQNFLAKETDSEMINHIGHHHPLVLFNTQTSLHSKSVSLHDPMKKIQLLCDGCVKPIMMVPFYKCSEDAAQQYCSFVLHTWCATLPAEIQHHPGHRQHSVLSLVTRIPDKNFVGIFTCRICMLPSNGFAYACTTCGYYVDINCAFIPKEITHEAHPNHLLLLVSFFSTNRHTCVGCLWYLNQNEPVYHCRSCTFYLHPRCALLLTKIVRHKYDKHPLSLRYHPAENHASEYFCDICEHEFNPREWFYHCTTCVASMHSACAPLILQCEKAVYSRYEKSVFEFLNVKFGGSLEIGDHPHRFTFVQGMKSDGRCRVCHGRLQYEMIFNCFECKFAFHHRCASLYAPGPRTLKPPRYKIVRRKFKRILKPRGYIIGRRKLKRILKPRG